MQEPISRDIDVYEFVSCSEGEKFLSRGIHMSQELDTDSLLTLGQELCEDSAWPL